MKGNYFQKVLMLVLANLIVKPLWIFGVEIAVQNRLGSETYGHYSAMLFLSMILQILLDLGLQTYNTQKISQNHARINYLLPNIITAKLILAIGYLAILMLLAWQLQYDSSSLKLLFLLGIAQVFNSFSMYFRSCITALQFYNVDIFLSVLDKALMIAISFILLYSPKLGEFQLSWFIYTQIFSYLLSGIISLLLVFKHAKISAFKIQTKYVIPVIKKSLPVALLILLMALFMRGDLIVLERLKINLDPAQAGQYAAAYRFVDAANNFTGLLLAAWLLPLFGKHLSDTPYIQNLVSSALRILMPIAMVMIVFTFFFGEAIMHFFYKDYQVGEGFLLFLFMLAFPFYCLTYIFSTLNTAADKIKQLCYFATVAFAFNILANLILVPKFGVYAVAINSVITQAIFSLSNLIYAFRHSHVRIKGRAVLRVFAFAGIIAGFCYIAKLNNLHIIHTTVIIAIVSIITVFLLKIIRIGELKSYE